MMNPTVDIDEMSKASATSQSSQICDPLDQNQRSNTLLTNENKNDKSTSKIWVVQNPSNNDNDNETDNNINVVNDSKQQDDNDILNPSGELGDAFVEEASHQLLVEQLTVYRAKKEKLYHETDMLKLKKDKLRLQMNCYTAEIEKQKMEKEKLRLQIELLRSKFIDTNTEDISHYIIVP